MEPIEIPGWLQIDLLYKFAKNDGGLNFEIVFKNITNKEHLLAFSNRARKAELLGLRVFDEIGQLVMPQTREIIALKNNNTDVHAIPPYGQWVYVLEGEFVGDYLEFRGAAYKIKRGCNVNFKFVFQKIESNLISVRLPL